MYAYSSTFHPLFSILIFETEYFPSHLSPFSLKFKLILKHLYGYYNKIREMLMYVFSTSYRKVSVCFCYTGSCAEPFRVSIPWTHKVLDYREWQMHECKLVNYVCVLVRVYVCAFFIPSASFEQWVLSAKPGNKISNKYRYAYAIRNENAYKDSILMLKEEESG